MARKTLWLWGVAAAVLALAAPAARAQEVETRAAEVAMDKTDPDVVDPNTIKGDHWTLDITYEAPQPILVLGPTGEKAVYWYMIYTITNNTGADRQYVPGFTLFADNGAVRKAGVYPAAYAAVQKQRSGKYKFLENAVQMVAIQTSNAAEGGEVLKSGVIRKTGLIEVGEDNARTGVAIFAPLDRDTDKFTVFVEGLSGEFIERPDRPKKVEPGHLTEGDKLVRLRKTLAVTYDLPGDKWWLNLDTPVFLAKKWTWR